MEETISSKITQNFRNDIVKEAIKTQFSNPKNKITDDALELVSELCKIMVIEASVRAAKQASLANKETVNLEHVESIIPQMMLDFP